MSSLTKTFQFDQVFGPNSKQIEVYRYEEIHQPMFLSDF
jgi:hypothetical protein